MNSKNFPAQLTTTYYFDDNLNQDADFFILVDAYDPNRPVLWANGVMYDLDPLFIENYRFQTAEEAYKNQTEFGSSATTKIVGVKCSQKIK